MKKYLKHWPIVLPTLLSIVALGVYLKRSQVTPAPDFFSNPELKLDRPEVPSPSLDMTLPLKTYVPLKSTLPPPVPPEKISASEQLKKQFSAIAKIYIPYPKKMFFREIDLDPNMLAISGFDFVNSTNLTLIVRRGTVAPSEILPFLKENAKILPNLTPEILAKFPSPDPLDINPKSGLIDNTLWEFKTETMGFYFLFANRKDGKGCYLAIFSGTRYGVNLDSPEIHKMADEIKAVE